MINIEELKSALQQYVDAGNNLQDLSQKDEIYKKIKNWDLIIDEKRATIEEKFKFLGFTRDKIRLDIDDIKTLINVYLINGGDTTAPIKSFPFYNQIHAMVRTKQNNGFSDYNFYDAMNALGYPQFSGIYNTYEVLNKLENFKDKNGNVDSYRKDNPMRSAICAFADRLDIPESLIVLLVAKQKLNTVYIKTDRIEFLKQNLIEFASKNHNSLVGIKSLNPRLYDLFSSCRHYYCNQFGTSISAKEFLKLLDLDYFDDRFKEESKNYDPKHFVQNLIKLASEYNNEISNEQFRKLPCYKTFYMYLRRNNLTIQDYLANLGIKYLNFQIHESNTLVAFEKYPYIDEMREMRDKNFNDYLEKNKNATKQEIMKKYIEFCQNAYKQFKEKIYNDPLNINEKY